MASDETPEQAAERLLPCNCTLHVAATSLHYFHCHARLRPAVAAALRERDERIAELEDTLREERHCSGILLGVSEDERRSLTAERDRLRAALEEA